MGPGSSKHFIDPKLIHGVESRMLEYTRIEPPMEIRVAGDNMLHSTAQGILLVVVRDADDVLRKVKLPNVLVPGLKKIIFSSLAAAQKGVKTVIEKNGSFLDLGLFVQFTRFDNIDHLDLMIAKISRTVSAYSANSGKTFGKESGLTNLVPKKPVAMSIGSINNDRRAIENASVEGNNKNSTY